MSVLGVLTLREGVTWEIDDDHAELVIDATSPPELRDLSARMYVSRAVRRHNNCAAYIEEQLAEQELILA